MAREEDNEETNCIIADSSYDDVTSGRLLCFYRHRELRNLIGCSCFGDIGCIGILGHDRFFGHGRRDHLDVLG